MKLEKTVHVHVSMLQIRRGKRDNLGIIRAIFLHKNISCDPSFEPFHQDSSKEGSQHVFIEK